MTLLPALFSAVVALALFGLSTDAHHQRRFGARPSEARRKAMRLAAWAAVALAFPLAVRSHGWIFGPVLFAALVMLAAGLVFLFLNLTDGKAGKR